MKLVKWLLFITAAALPLYIVRCRDIPICEKIAPFPITLLEVLILLTVASWIAWKYLDIKKGKDSPQRLLQRLKTPILLPALVLVLAALVTSFIAADVKGGLGIFKAYFLEGVLLYLVAYDFLVVSSQLKVVLAGVSLGGLWLAALSILEWVSRWNISAPQELLLRNRVSGVYSTANALGLFLVPIFILVCSWLVWEFKKERRISPLLLFSSLILFGGILVSGSRGAFLGLGVTAVFGVVWLIFNRFKRERLFVKLTIATFVLVLAGQLLFFLNIDKFTPVSGTKNTADSRVCLWQGTVNLIKERPLLGAGLNAFRDTYPAYRTCSQEVLQYPHNLLLNFWVEVGLVGLISFLIIVGIQLWQLLNSKKDFALKIGLAAVLVSIFGHGFVDVPFFKNDLAAAFWLFLALGSYLIFKGSEKKVSRQ